MRSVPNTIYNAEGGNEIARKIYFSLYLNRGVILLGMVNSFHPSFSILLQCIWARMTWNVLRKGSSFLQSFCQRLQTETFGPLLWQTVSSVSAKSCYIRGPIYVIPGEYYRLAMRKTRFKRNPSIQNWAYRFSLQSRLYCLTTRKEPLLPGKPLYWTGH